MGCALPISIPWPGNPAEQRLTTGLWPIPEGEAENGPGIWITNQDTATEYYYIYENLRDTKPWKQVHVSA